MYLETAKQVADEFIGLISNYCKKVEIAGSVRRKRSSVNDIDVVVIPKPEFFSKLSRLNAMGNLQLLGHKYCQNTMWYSLESVFFKGVIIDIYSATDEDFDIAMLVWTGSDKHNIHLVSLAKKKGLSFTTDDEGIWGIYKNGERLTNNTEESVYQVLGLSYHKPEDRD